MKIVLATGIYPPDIGGPATYVRALAEEFSRRGEEVIVVAYGSEKRKERKEGWPVVCVSKVGGPLIRWWRYAKALKMHAADADVVQAFSSVSVGVPLIMAKLEKPKKILRLGGDFFWERYTGRGGLKSLREWYERGNRLQVAVHSRILNSFDHIVFSTKFQQDLYLQHYEQLPQHSVIQNALPEWNTVVYEKHNPFRLLFVGRFVGFKNLPSLIRAMVKLPDCTLTLTGTGPMEWILRSHSNKPEVKGRVSITAPKHGAEKLQLFADHDLLVIPSVTEISPNIALEARAAGLPILLTNETGLSEQLSGGMVLADLEIPYEIAQAVHEVRENYDQIAEAASRKYERRSWEHVASDHLQLFSSV